MVAFGCCLLRAASGALIPTAAGRAPSETVFDSVVVGEPAGVMVAAAAGIAVLLAVVKWRVDARIALAVAAVMLCVIGWKWTPVLHALPLHRSTVTHEIDGISYRVLSAWLVTMSAFGFAAVLKSSTTPAGLTQVITRLVKGSHSTHISLVAAVGVVASFFASMLLLSANAACIIVGPIIAPILSSFGVPPAWAGACIVAGAWGAVLNVGDGNVSVISSSLGKCKDAPYYTIWGNILPAIAGLVAVIVVLALTKPKGLAAAGAATGARALRSDSSGATNNRGWYWPLVPTAALPVIALTWSDDGQLIVRNVLFSTVFVIAAAVAAGCSIDKSKSGLGVFGHGLRKSLFGVVLLILASKFLAESVKLYVDPGDVVNALTNTFGGVIVALPLITAGFAAICGSGDAAIAFTVGFMIPVIDKAGVADPRIVASLLWFAGEMGRCASPTAAATHAVAGLEHVAAKDIARHAAIPLMAGLAASGLVTVANLFG